MSKEPSLLKTIIPSDVVSIMEFRELATAAREGASQMTAAIREGSEMMSGGMRDAGEGVGGALARAGMWVGGGVACLAAAWCFVAYLDYLKHVNPQPAPKGRRLSAAKVGPADGRPGE